MACCGPNIKYENSNKLLENLRKFNNMDVHLELNESKMTYKIKNAKWESN